LVGLGVGIDDGIELGEGLGIIDGDCEGMAVVGESEGLVVGTNVGSALKGVGSRVVGNFVGAGDGAEDGIGLGEVLGI